MSRTRPLSIIPILVFCMLSLQSIVFAQTSVSFPWGVVDPQSFAKYLFPNMPEEWLTMPSIIYYVFVPFITAWTVVYGLLMELRLFRGYNAWKINIVIAFCMAFLMLPSGILVYTVNILYGFGAFFATVCFGILFIVGTFLWARHRGYEMYYQDFSIKQWQKNVDDSIKQGEDQSKKIVEKEKKQRTEIDNTISKLKRRLSDLLRRLGEAQSNVDRLSKIVIDKFGKNHYDPDLPKLQDEKNKWEVERDRLTMEVARARSELNRALAMGM